MFTGGQFGQLQGSSGPTPPSLEEVLSQRGFDAPAMQTGMQNAMQSMFKDPITGEYRTGGQHAANHANAMSKFYSQNPEALEIAKQYNTDPTQFGGKPPQIRTRGPESLATQGRSMQQPQQRGGMFNQQNQFGGQQGQQGMQQMMQFMQQMMQMFSMMSGQNRSGGFGGGFGGQQQYQQPQRYQPQPRQQYQPPPRQQFQPVQQQYGQMGPQQPSPFAQSIRPRY